MKPERIEQIYDLIGTFVIELERDPTTLGQRYIQDKVALCREYLNKTSALLLEIQREYRQLNSRLHSERTLFAIESDNLRATNQVIQRLPHDNDRTAHINMLLSERRGLILSLEREIEDLKIIEKAVKHRFDELKGTNTDIRTQRSSLRDELDTGAFYGDETDTPKARRKSTVEDDELERIMRGEWESTVKEVQKTDPPTPQPINKVEIDDLMDTVLASVPSQKPASSNSTPSEVSEFESFVKMELPPGLSVSVKGTQTASIADEDFSKYLEGI